MGSRGFRIMPASKVIDAPTSAPSTAMGQFSIKITKQKIANGTTEFTVKKNDEVVLHIISDEDDVLHLLGYEQRVPLQKNKEVVLSFIAEKSGKYAFELQNHHLQLGILTIK